MGKVSRARALGLARSSSVAALLLASVAGPAFALPFTAGDLVVSVEGNGSGDAANGTSATGNTGASASVYEDNQAAPITLYEYSTTGTGQSPIGALELPTATSGSNSVISGEYGSSSEGELQLSGNGQYLLIAGYGVNAAQYNAASDLNGGGTALAQSCSLSVAANCAGVPQATRVVATIDAGGTVNTSTVLTDVFNTNNPRSVASPDGKTLYLAGQGVNGDTTEGIFVTTLGSTTATAINTLYDTRSVQIYNGQLYISQDSKAGAGQTAFIGSVGTGLPTGAANVNPLVNSKNVGVGTGSKKSPTLPGVSLTLSNGNGNSVNKSTNTAVYLSPNEFFFANSTTLYVADTGNPKAGGQGDGGLQKWSLVGGTWDLDYTLSAGLNLVDNTSGCASTSANLSAPQADCTTGLAALTAQIVGNQVELFATNYTLGDTNASYLYSITDTLSDTLASQVSGETFTELAEAPADAAFKGVAFAPTPAPVPEPGSLAVLAGALIGFTALRRRMAR